MTDKEKEIIEPVEVEEANTEVEEKEETPEVEVETEREVKKDEEIASLKAELTDWQQSYMRKQAEFQNYAKRKDKEVEELRKYAAEKVMSKLLDGVDNLERAINVSSETKDFDNLVKGVEMTLTQFKNIMQAEGVEAIDVKVGDKYDPHIHMAVAVEPSDKCENDEIIEIFQKGYKMKDKIIRPAMVKVCKK
jgi:molecular chaperone GrpE